MWKFQCHLITSNFCFPNKEPETPDKHNTEEKPATENKPPAVTSPPTAAKPTPVARKPPPPARLSAEKRRSLILEAGNHYDILKVAFFCDNLLNKT